MKFLVVKSCKVKENGSVGCCFHFGTLIRGFFHSMSKSLFENPIYDSVFLSPSDIWQLLPDPNPNRWD